MLMWSTRAKQTLLFFVLVSTSMGQLFAQENQVSLNVRDIALGEVLERISQQTGLEFSYNPKRIDVQQKVSITVTNEALKTVLDQLTAKTGNQFIVMNNQIVIQPPKAKTVLKTTFGGFVKDAATGEPLIGATVLIKELGIGTITNAFGFFSITTTPGSYTLEFAYIGYKTVTTSIELPLNSNVDIKLAEEPPVLPELVVYDEGESVITSAHPGETDLKPKFVKERTSYFGEVDVLKSLESVPGVKMHSDGSSFYYVRGGNRDQNLVLIDDAPIYNPSHLLGVFSTIIPDAVNDIKFYSGDAPVSIGGRLSSVLDVRTKKGNDQHLSFWGGASLISTRAGMEGPFTKDKSSWLVSTRISRLGWLARSGNSNVTEFQFYDLTGKMNFSVNAKNRIFFSFYTGQDGYFNPAIGIRWNNNAGTIKWSSAVNDRLFINTTLVASGYTYFLYTDVANNQRWRSQIGAGAIKSDLTYFISPTSEINSGIAATGYNFNPGNFEGNSSITAATRSSLRNASEFVWYASHSYAIDSRWKVNYGARLSSWVNTGNSFEFVYNDSKQVIDTLYFTTRDRYGRYVNLEPRASLRYEFGKNNSIKASFARNVQNVHLVSNTVSPFSSLEVWLPSSINVKPQTSNQITLGYYRAFPSVGITTTIEAYDKHMANLIDFVPHAETMLNPLLESQLLFGKGRAYGVEVQLKKTEGRVRGLAGYTYSRSKRTFDGINAGRTFNAFSDRPHQVNLTLSYEVNPRWELGANWNFSTGAPFSSPVGFYSFNGSSVPVFGEKNNDRLPDYHRLDISGTWKLNRNPEQKYQHSLTFSIFNFYGRKNALFYNYNKVVAADGSLDTPGNLLSANYVVSKYYLSRFTPSVAYNFRWR